jgi:hypothetical protein
LGICRMRKRVFGTDIISVYIASAVYGILPHDQPHYVLYCGLSFILYSTTSFCACAAVLIMLRGLGFVFTKWFFLPGSCCLRCPEIYSEAVLCSPTLVLDGSRFRSPLFCFCFLLRIRTSERSLCNPTLPLLTLSSVESYVEG